MADVGDKVVWICPHGGERKVGTVSSIDGENVQLDMYDGKGETQAKAADLVDIVTWPDCGHQYAADDPRLESDDCPRCFTAYQSFAHRIAGGE